MGHRQLPDMSMKPAQNVCYGSEADMRTLRRVVRLVPIADIEPRSLSLGAAHPRQPVGAIEDRATSPSVDANRSMGACEYGANRETRTANCPPEDHESDPQVDTWTLANSKLLRLNLMTATTRYKRQQGQVPQRTYCKQEHVEMDCQNNKLGCYWS